MSIKKNIESISGKLEEMDSEKASIEQKLDELTRLLEEADINSHDALLYKERFDNALQKGTLTTEDLERYKQLDNEDMSRLDMLDELGKLLITTPLDNQSIKQYRKKEWLTFAVVFAIGLTLMALGFAMIVIPAPGSFEIYTLFYFTRDDGVTIMDIISLLIILTGVFIIVTAMKKRGQ